MQKGSSMGIVIRMLHDIPKGVSLSKYQDDSQLFDSSRSACILTPLCVTMRDDGLWELSDTLKVKVLGRSVTVPAGYLTDFSSVCRIPLIFELFGDTAHLPATVHDYMYDNDVEYTRYFSDCVFYELMAYLRIPVWRRYPMFLAVRVFGGIHRWLYRKR